MKLTTARMAWRNLWRHKQRTILMIATVAVGSLVILVLFGLTDGMVGSLTATQVEWNQGNFQVRSALYADDPIPENAMSSEQVAAATAALAKMRTAGIAPRMETFGMLRSAYGTDGVMLRGIDPTREPKVTRLDRLVVEGRYLDAAGQILLPTTLAEDLDIRVGERVVVLAIGAEGTDSRAFVVAGLFHSPSFDLEQTAMASIDDVRSLTGVEGATALAIALPKGGSDRRAVEEARQILADHEGVTVADFFDLNPFARFMISGATLKMIPFVIMISLMAGFGVANTAFYSVLERTREFGVMTAVGMSRKLLARMVLLESTFAAAIGFVAGGGLGYGGLLYLSRNGWDISVLTDMVGSLGVPRVVYASTSGWYWVAALSVVVFTALVAAWYPARRVNRLEPVAAIREG
ncbi:MAG: ABC transporter permease [Candidatus Bipolaricaulota bacterium]|nr:MAG: ABC transporter permease [Candidatus Bipolaricaulota bacterium]